MSNVAAVESSFSREVSLPALLAAQNDDGGWGYWAASESAIEPTSWGLLAICRPDSDGSRSPHEYRAARFLKKTQLADGSWPTVIGEKQGGWVTSMASLALREAEGESREANLALEWLCRDWPGDGGLWWRARRRLSERMRAGQRSDGLRGWSWTSGTSSWVEPTAHALLALRGAQLSSAAQERAKRRRQQARKMLCNRMCCDGGWNCGNERVYGSRGSPLVGPTAWALLALAEFGGEPSVEDCVRQSLCWLEGALGGIRSPGSLALAHLCLRAHGRVERALDAQLFASYEEGRFMEQIPVLAWTILALRPSTDWFRPEIFQTPEY